MRKKITGKFGGVEVISEIILPTELMWTTHRVFFVVCLRCKQSSVAAYGNLVNSPPRACHSCGGRKSTMAESKLIHEAVTVGVRCPNSIFAVETLVKLGKSYNVPIPSYIVGKIIGVSQCTVDNIVKQVEQINNADWYVSTDVELMPLADMNLKILSRFTLAEMVFTWYRLVTSDDDYTEISDILQNWIEILSTNNVRKYTVDYVNFLAKNRILPMVLKRDNHDGRIYISNMFKDITDIYYKDISGLTSKEVVSIREILASCNDMLGEDVNGITPELFIYIKGMLLQIYNKLDTYVPNH